MKKDVFETKWKVIRNQTPEWWSLMNEEDLKKVDKAPVKIDKYTTMLQVKYGYTRKGAKEEITKRVSAFEIEQAELNADDATE